MSLLTRRDNAVETLIIASTVISRFCHISLLLKSLEDHASFLLWPFAEEIKEKASSLTGGILQQVSLTCNRFLLCLGQLAFGDFFKANVIRI